MEWRLIKTAPKDGTSVLVACNYERKGRHRVTLAWWKDGDWVEGEDYDDDLERWVGIRCAFRPSHWMPLPPPPDVCELSGGGDG